MKVGILGSGFMGGTHARAFATLPDVQIVAVSAQHLEHAEALAREVGARATTNDLEILSDPAIDAVSITLPTHLHREAAILALQNGKHVLLEKPFALSVADCDAVIDAQRTSGKQLMLAHVLRFWPEYVTLVDFVKSGQIGKPLAATATRLSAPPGWAQWFRNPALSGGAVLDMCIHDFDVLNWLFGTPQTVYARGQQAAPDLWNHVAATVDFGAVSGTVEGSHFMPPEFPFTSSLRVVCEGGAVEYAFRAGGATVTNPGGSSLTVYEPGKASALPVQAADGYVEQIAYFVECVRADRAPERGTPEQARLAVRTCLAARESMETGQVVRVE